MGKAAALGSDWAVVTSDNPRTEDPLRILEEVEAGIRETGRPRLTRKTSPPARKTGGTSSSPIGAKRFRGRSEPPIPAT